MRGSATSKVRIAALLALIPGLLGVATVRWPVTAGLEKTYGLGLLNKLRGPRTPPADVCVVAIDDASFIELGLDPLRPVPRSLYGELVRTLATKGARSTSFDVLFEGPSDKAQDNAFELGMFDADNVVLGATIERTDDPRFRQARLIDPYEPFAEVAKEIGEVELPPDDDGVIRQTWLVPGDRPSLALAGYEVATGDLSHRDERGTRLIDYYGPPRTIPTVSLYQALDPGRFLPPGFLDGKLVFVGASQVAAVGHAEVKDSFPTPFSGGEVGFTYGVEIHATVAANLLEGRTIHTLPAVTETTLLLVLALLASVLFILLRPISGVAALLVLELGAWGAGYFAFAGHSLWIPVVVPSAVQLPAAFVVSLIWYYLTTYREREKIRRAFSFYLSPEMIQRISDSQDSLNLGGEEIVGTAMFTDIKGFTSLAERMTAPETASMLNDYFSHVTGEVFATRGTLIKYIGDAVFAIWGAPLPMDDHASAACRAATAIARLEDPASDSQARRLVTRIGVHTGPMLVGNLGSAQRFDYTAIGDTINLAARLESLNKTVGTRALISGEAMAAANVDLIVRRLGRFRVVGRSEPVELFEPLGRPGESTRPDAEGIALFENALAEFAAGRLDEAAAGFEDVLRRCGGNDGPSELYLRTIDELRRTPPPADWDGVINVTKK